MPPDIETHDLEEWADKLRSAYGDGDDRLGSVARAQAVVTGDDGLSRYRVEELWQEIAYLGYHLHWDLGTLLDLEHRDRRHLVKQVADLNERAWEEVRNRGR